MLPLNLVISLSPIACKLYLIMLARAQGRQVTASLEDLAADARVSERTARTAVQELLGARILRRFPRHYHTPSTYLISPPQDTGKTPPINRQPIAGLLTHSAALSCSSITPQATADKALMPPDLAETNRQLNAALLTLSATLQNLHNPSVADPDTAFLDAFEAIPLEIRQAAFRQLPEATQNAIIAEAQAALARLDAAEAAQT